ncbi:DUF6286 domain-containing protein [Egicoccus sp. AB-alg2]|uniref:DUF6286 domain-containing protein n=1 Tax=Egicoccus sp. AB-alg2 TaxID=3242693 RepID=UPI00359CEE14
MVPRVVERLVALVFWGAVTALAVVVATDVVLANLGRPERLVDVDAVRDAIGGFALTSTEGVLVAALLLVLGLALLALQFVPRGRRAFQHHATERVTVMLERRGLERRLAATAEGDEDVRSARVRIRRRARVRVYRVEGTDDRSLRQRLRTALRAQLDELVARRAPRVRLDVRSSGGRVR